MNIQELLTYLRIIKKRLWLIGLLMGVTLGVMVVLSYTSKPVYQATASFRVTTPFPTEVSLYQEFRSASSRDELAYTRNNFKFTLQSRDVIWQVIGKLALSDMDADDILNNMVVQASENSDFTKLKITAHNPKRAAAIANTLTEVGAQYFAEISAGSITADKEFIHQQIEEIEAELSQAQADLVQFQLENRIGSIDQLFASQHALIRQLNLSHDAEEAQGNQEMAQNYEEIATKRERELQNLILLNSEYRALQERVDRIDAVYSTLLSKEIEARLKENEILSARFVQIIPAREPSRPLPRIQVSLLVLGSVVSLAVGIGLSFVLEYLSNVTAQTNDQTIACSHNLSNSEAR